MPPAFSRTVTWVSGAAGVDGEYANKYVDDNARSIRVRTLGNHRQELDRGRDLRRWHGPYAAACADTRHRDAERCDRVSPISCYSGDNVDDGSARPNAREHDVEVIALDVSTPSDTTTMTC